MELAIFDFGELGGFRGGSEGDFGLNPFSS